MANPGTSFSCCDDDALAFSEFSFYRALVDMAAGIAGFAFDFQLATYDLFEFTVSS
jgi:hypothetical protein